MSDSPKSGNYADLAERLLIRAAGISQQMETGLVAQEAARHISEILTADICAISKWDRDQDTVMLLAEYSPDDQKLETDWRQPARLSKYPVMVKVLNSGKPLLIAQDDHATDQSVKDFLKRIGMQAVYILPLESHDGIIGVVEVFSRKRSLQVSEDQAAQVRLLAAHSGVVMERTRLLHDAEQKAAALEALRRASLSLTASLDLEQVLAAILESTLGILDDALDAHIFLYDGEDLSVGAALWADGSKDVVWSEPRREGLTYKVAATGESILVRDMQNHPLYENNPERWSGAIIGVPLKIGSRVVGVMNVAYQLPREFSPDELQVINLLADQAALAVENARLHRIVKKQALTDTLTGLPNRRAFNQRLEEEILRSKRYERTFSLVMIDFDDFKLINDTFGHPAGDETLIRIGGCLKERLRDTDFIARIGGDEYAVILPETTIEEARMICAQLKETVKTCEFTWQKENSLYIYPSTGIANYPEHAEEGEGLISAADKALYTEKRAG
ncbi:MAG: diguanylate cyclase [Anaerolineae bacterium]|nr:diguanylate cyclase [Anaerolineae bacterium]